MTMYQRELGKAGPGPIPGAEITARLNGCAALMLILVCAFLCIALVLSSSVPVN